MRTLLYFTHHLRNTGEEMCFINLLPNVVITGLDTDFVNIFSSVSSYCLHLLSPVLILHGLSQRVTDVPLITNVEEPNLLLEVFRGQKGSPLNNSGFLVSFPLLNLCFCFSL